RTPDAARTTTRSARLRRWLPGFASRRPGSSALAHACMVNAELRPRQKLPTAAMIDRAPRAARCESPISSIDYGWHAARIVKSVAVRALGDARANGEQTMGFVRAGIAALAVVLALGASGASHAASRIKDLASVEGVRQNQLIGYGLVVGLNGTGDTLNNIPFTKQSLQAMLERLGVNIRGQTLRTGNVA